LRLLLTNLPSTGRPHSPTMDALSRAPRGLGRSRGAGPRRSGPPPDGRESVGQKHGTSSLAFCFVGSASWVCDAGSSRGAPEKNGTRSGRRYLLGAPALAWSGADWWGVVGSGKELSPGDHEDHDVRKILRKWLRKPGWTLISSGRW